MDLKTFPVIDPVATGNNIRRLRMERGLTVRELQSYFGFAEPRAIYKWQKGESLPTVDSRVLEHLHQNALTSSDLQQIRKAVNFLMPMCQANRQIQRELMGINARTTALLNISR